MCQGNPIGRKYFIAIMRPLKIKENNQNNFVKCCFYTNGARGTMCKSYSVNNSEIISLHTHTDSTCMFKKYKTK